MSFNNILQMATLFTILIGIISILVKISSHRRQINASLFIEYANRYDDIIMSFPKHAWAHRFAGGDRIPEESDELTICVFRFLHFLAGAYYFHKKGYLEKDAWQLWEGGINRILRSPLFRREWRRFSQENLLSPEFRGYVEAVQSQE